MLKKNKKIKPEVYLTEIEREVLFVFVNRMILKNEPIIGTLESLIKKLEAFVDE